MALFEIQIHNGDGRVDVALSGEIDLSTVAAVQERIDAGPSAQDGILVVDLRAVEFLDSSGLRMLLALDERQRAGGGSFALVRGPRRVDKVFELTGIGERITIVEDPAQASA